MHIVNAVGNRVSKARQSLDSLIMYPLVLYSIIDSLLHSILFKLNSIVKIFRRDSVSFLSCSFQDHKNFAH